MNKYIIILLLNGLLSLNMFSQTSNTKSTLTQKPTVATLNMNTIGSYFINYEIKNTNQPAKTGKVFYALDNKLVAISPSNPNLKDITNLRMVIDLKEGEMTMLTTDIKNKKNGLLTKLPKPVLNKTSTVKKAPIVTKTGIFKTIQGFKCEKTLINIGDSIQIESYITTEILIDVANAISLSNSSLRTKSPFTNLVFDVKGTAMESIITYKNGDTVKLILSDIRKGKPEPAAFSTNGYNIMDARGLPMFNGN
jgi:hypothetical protein